MQIIALNKKFLKIFGMCLNEDTATNKERAISTCVNWLMFAISVCTIIVSVEYIYSHFADTENILFAGMQVAANTATGGGYWTFYRKKYKVFKLIEDIAKLVKSRM